MPTQVGGGSFSPDYLSGIAQIGNALNDTDTFWADQLGMGEGNELKKKMAAAQVRLLEAQARNAGNENNRDLYTMESTTRNQNMNGMDFLGAQRMNAQRRAATQSTGNFRTDFLNAISGRA
jgi:hypothetical protein